MDLEARLAMVERSSYWISTLFFNEKERLEFIISCNLYLFFCKSFYQVVIPSAYKKSQFIPICKVVNLGHVQLQPIFKWSTVSALPIIIIYYESLLPHHTRGTVAFHTKLKTSNGKTSSTMGQKS